LFSCFDGWSDQLYTCRCSRHLIVLNIFSVLCWSIYICIYLHPVFFAVYIGASLSYVIQAILEAYQVRISNNAVIGSNMPPDTLPKFSCWSVSWLPWKQVMFCHLASTFWLIELINAETSGFCMGTPCILHLDSMKGSHLDAGEIIRKWVQLWVSFSLPFWCSMTLDCLLVMRSCTKIA
jgi:hypothetical protein